MIKITALENSHIVLTLSSILELLNDGVPEEIAFLRREIEDSIEILRSAESQDDTDWLEENNNYE